MNLKILRVNYIKVRTILERVNTLFVVIVEEEVEDITQYSEGQIVRQDPPGTEVVPGDCYVIYT